MAFGQLFRICSSAVRRVLSRFSTAILLGFLAMTAACTGSVNVVVIATGLSAGTHTRFAYVANRNDNTLSIFVVDTLFDVNGDKGQMRHNGYVVTGTEPVSVAADPSGSFVFVANSGDDTLSAYAVDEDNGRLTEVAGSPFGTGMTPASVAVSPSGTFVFVANSGDNTVSVFSVDILTGVLTEVMSSPFATGANPMAVASTAGDGLIFVANTDDNTVSSFSYDPSVGELTEVTGSPFPTGTGPTSITVNSTGSIAYVTNFLGGTVSAFAVSNKGQLAELGSSPYLTQNNPFSVTVSPTGRFAYVTNFGSNNVSGFDILSDGSLMEIVGSPFGSGTDPISFAMDLSECSAVAVNSGENSVSEYTVDSLTGELLFDRIVRTRVGPASISMAAGMRPVTFLPQFAYTANQNSADVSSYSIDSLTGELTELANSPAPAGSTAFDVVLDPLGDFAYVPSAGTSTLSFYRIGSDGALTELSGLPFGSGSPITVPSAQAAAVDPSGRFVYAGSNTSVLGFTIDRASGSLTAMSMAFPAGIVGIDGVRVDPTGRFLIAVGGTQAHSLSIDSTTGELAAVSTSSSGSNSHYVEISPAGTSAYVSDRSGGITRLTISSTGVLSAATVNTTPPNVSFSSELDPTGKFLLAPDLGSSNAIVFSINSVGGAITNIGTVPGLSSPTGAAVDISVRFAYFCNFGNSTISQFTIDPATGTLTPLVGAASVATGSGPLGMTTSGIYR